MIKDDVAKILEEGQKGIDNIKGLIEEVANDTIHSEEWKSDKIKDLQNSIKNIISEHTNKALKLFDEEIKKLESINPYADNNPEETANILKMIELSRNTMTEGEIKHLLNTYKDNGIVVRALSSVAAEKDIPLGESGYIPKTDNVEFWKNETASVLSRNTSDLETLGTSVLLNSMDI